MSTTTTARPRSTKKYKALIAAGLDDSAALGVMGVSLEAAEPVVEPEIDPRITSLVEAGFKPEQAAQIVAEQDAGSSKKKSKKAKKAKADAPAELSPKERAEALVAERGLTFTRGRVYVTSQVIEAQARVMKTGAPEVVQTSGVGHINAVLIYREDSGDVAVQNLRKPV